MSSETSFSKSAGGLPEYGKYFLTSSQLESVSITERETRLRYESIRTHYHDLMSLQANELAERCRLIASFTHSILDMKDAWNKEPSNRQLSPDGRLSEISQYHRDIPANIITGFVENSGNYSFDSPAFRTGNDTQCFSIRESRPSPALSAVDDASIEDAQERDAILSSIDCGTSDFMKSESLNDSPAVSSVYALHTDVSSKKIPKVQSQVEEFIETPVRISGKRGDYCNLLSGNSLDHDRVDENGDDLSSSPVSPVSKSILPSRRSQSTQRFSKGHGPAMSNLHNVDSWLSTSPKENDSIEFRPSFDPTTLHGNDHRLSIRAPFSPQPMPHTPSHVVDKRLLQKDGSRAFNEETLRFWWESQSPIHDGGDASSAKIRTPLTFPSPHQADMNPSPPDDLLSKRPLESLGQASGSRKMAQLIHKTQNRERFPHENHPCSVPQEIRDGYGWIWHYKIMQEKKTIFIMYMCSESILGCLVLNPETASYSAVVYDKDRDLVFFVPRLENKEIHIDRQYTHPHPYIKTHYKDSIIMLRAIDVQQMSGKSTEEYLLSSGRKRPTREEQHLEDLPRYLSIIKEYSDELSSIQLPFRTPTGAKLVYLRKFFFDYKKKGDPSWYLFRLSNGHAMILNPQKRLQIRWLTTPIRDPSTSKEPFPKYMVKGDRIEPFDDPKYFESVRETLRAFDNHAHNDVSS